MKNSLFERCRGFSMIEVLVTMFVLSVGILGMVGLQAQGLKNNHSAYIKSQVISTINDMADRMRANSEGLNNNRYAAIDTSTLSSNPGYDCVTDYSGTTSGTKCNDQELALSDIYSWGKGLTSLFPNGYGTVTCETSCNDGTLPTCTDGTSSFPCVDTSTPSCSDSSTPACQKGSLHVIKVFWDDDRDGTANTSFSVTTAL